MERRNNPRMCGRFTHLYTWRQLHRLLGLTTPPTDWPPRYNVAPTQSAPVVRALIGGRPVREPDAPGGEATPTETVGRPGHGVSMLRWGLVPSWAEDLSFGLRAINARAETVATSPAFRSALRQRRCIVPVSGYFEWRKVSAVRKQPYYFTATDQQPMLLAGLWESWSPRRQSPDDPDRAAPVETFTIITTTPNLAAAKFHDRMPVILDPADISRWLAPESDPASVLDLLRPSPAELLVATPVSTLVNNARVDLPGCIQPVDPPSDTPPNESGGLFD